MTNSQKLAKLKKQYGNDVVIAEAFVRLLQIKKADKLYPSAVEWAIIEILDDKKDTLTKREREQFEKDNKAKKVGAVHKKIIKQIETLYEINKILDGKDDITTSTLDQNIPAAPSSLPVADPVKKEKPEVKLESNIKRVPKGGSVNLIWTSKNATKVRRTNIPGVTTKSPINGSVEVDDIRRRRDFYIIVEGPGGIAESRVTTLVETQAFLQGKEKEPVDTPPQQPDAAPRRPSTSLVSPSSRPQQQTRTSRPVASSGDASSLNLGILLSIDKSLANISKILFGQLKLNQRAFDIDRRRRESEIRQGREEEMEADKGPSGGELMKKGAEKILSPFKAIIDKIVNFLFFTFLGKVFTDVVKWFNDPENKEKVEALGRFIKDFWGWIVGAALLFLTPLGGLMVGAIQILGGFIKIAKGLSTNLISLGKLVLNNPYIAALAAVTVGSIARVKEKERLQPILKEKEKQIQQELDDEKTPWYKKLGLSFAKQAVGDTSAESQQTLPLLKIGSMYSSGGKIFSGTVTEKDGKKVSGAGKDTQAFKIAGGGTAVLQPGETVLQPGVRERIIKEKGVDVLAYNKGLNANNPQTLNTNIKLMNTGGVVGGPQISLPDYNTLLAISALESDEPQGRADVAQSIYNRLLAATKYGTNFLQKSNTVRGLITAPQQYQPTFTNQKDWMNINDDLKSAAMAVMNSAKGKRYKWTLKDAMGQLQATEKALRNPVLQKNSRLFVKGLPSFRGTSEHDYMRRDLGDVVRNSKSNFFTSYGMEDSKYIKEMGTKAAPIPSMLLPKTTQKQSNQKQSSGIFQPLVDFVGGVKTNIQNILPKKKYGGIIENNSGITLPYSQDNIMMRAERGEYVVPKIATRKIGIKVLDSISSLDPNFRIKNSTIEPPRPLSRVSNNIAPITLPPITQGAGTIPSAPGSGTQLPTFPGNPAGLADVRMALADIYGIV